MVRAKKMHPIVQLAKKAVESYVKEGEFVKAEEITPEMEQTAGVFVSIHKQGKLRGCIGTFEPMQSTVADEIVQNAISAATRDPRFNAVNASELDDLDYSVDVLTPPEEVTDRSQLDTKKYGLIVQCGYRRGLLLPDLEGVDTTEFQESICRQKGGISPSEPVKLFRFQVKRYK
jgi:MEMO1 family protein